MTAERADEIAGWLVQRLAELLGVPPGEIDPAAPLASYGLGSRDAVEVSGDLATWLGRRLPPTLLWDHPTIDALARALADPSIGARATPVDEDA